MWNVANLRKTMPRAILLLLSQFPETQEICIKDPATILNRSTSALHSHVTHLIQDRLIRSKRKGRIVVLKLLIAKDVINRLGHQVYPNRWDKFLDEIDNTSSICFIPRNKGFHPEIRDE